MAAHQQPFLGLREKSAALRRHTRAARTHDAYGRDWRHFQLWCESAGRLALPASADTLALDCTARLQCRGGRCASADRAIAGISHHHRA